MFESLSDRLGDIFKSLSGRGRLTKEEVELGMREVRLALLEADVNFKVARALVDRIRERAVGADVLESLTPGQQIVKIVNEEVVTLLGGEQRKLRYQSQPPTVVMLIGLQGSGKTTTCAKLALATRRDGHRPLLVAADIQRPAAPQQLEKLGKDNQIPVAMPDGKSKPPELCRRGLDEARRLNCDVVILDTAGRLQIDQRMLQELKEIRKRIPIHDTVLVVDAMTGQEAVNVAREFDQQVGVDGIILTKLDGDARGGAALSLKAVTGKPIKFIGTGEKLEEFEPFHPERMASRILGMGDVVSLVERAVEAVDLDDAKRMEEKMRKGRFSLEDFLEQLRAMKKLGSLESLVGMLPGGAEAIKRVDMNKQEKEFQLMEAIICGMTPQERRAPQTLNAKRRMRIARGSGVQVSDVNNLLNKFNQMQQMMKNMGKFQKMMGRMGGMPGFKR